MRAFLRQVIVLAIVIIDGVPCSTAFVPHSSTFSTSIVQRRRHQPPSTRLMQSTAGQGGGVFYDGPLQDKASFELTKNGSFSPPPSPQSSTKRRVQHKDVIVIGGGLAGLSAALYLTQMDPERHVTILEREESVLGKQKTTVASFAAAGMLAPQSERLPRGPLLDLCVASRRCYPDFVDLVESMAQDEEGKDYLWPSDDDDDEKPWSVGYVASGGFLAPAFAGDSVATWAPPEESGSATWLDAMQVRELEPNLHPDVVGGWWFPEDASVDARRLTCSLRAACVAAGVQIQTGAEVTSLDLVDGHCNGLWLASGKYLKAKSVLVANGAWMRNLLPVPIEPHKGQSISLRMPSDAPSMLRRVLFAQDTYIVPKADGRIVVGATVEAGSYDANVTPAGLMHIMTHAMQLVPGLGDLPLEESWVGLRPTTPDKGPILGRTPWDNLFLAGGYWRNGVLLAPKTGQLLASLLSGQPLSASDEALLDAFAWDRFTSPERSATVAADTRYAASMHPIHRRKSGTGVAAAVGTELGAYSTARSAGQERSQDRNALFSGDGDDALERAAAMGQKDADAFAYGDETEDSLEEELFSQQSDEPPSLPGGMSQVPALSSSSSIIQSVEDVEFAATIDEGSAKKYEGSVDAYTVASSQDDNDVDEQEQDLQSIYEQIKRNKKAVGTVEMGEPEPDGRKDPGFRIYFENPKTGEDVEVPPFTSPDDFISQLATETKQDITKVSAESMDGSNVNGASSTVSHESIMDGSNVNGASSMNGQQDDSIFDGYKAIEDANADISEQESREAMRQARLQNRGESEPLNLDHDSFSSIRPNETSVEPMNPPQVVNSNDQTLEPPQVEDNAEPPVDLQDVYDRIRQNKAQAAPSIEMGDAPEDDREDPGFRLYYVDPESGKSHEVPPFTAPETMVAMVREQKKVEIVPPLNGAVNGGSVAKPQQQQQLQQDKEYSETTFDGYQDIQQANARTSRQDELQAMRAARQQNRGGDDIDESKIGAHRMRS